MTEAGEQGGRWQKGGRETCGPNKDLAGQERAFSSAQL